MASMILYLYYCIILIKRFLAYMVRNGGAVNHPLTVHEPLAWVCDPIEPKAKARKPPVSTGGSSL